MVDRIRASYARLAAEKPALARKVAAVKPCQLCDQPAWSDGLCTEHLVERGRAITRERLAVRRNARRRAFFLAKRAARQSGDMVLWNEIEYRRRRGLEMYPVDLSMTAGWRLKWSEPPATPKSS